MLYDPEHPPDAKEWLALDEQERAQAVASYHQSAGEPPPRLELHTGMHLIVENQLAEGLACVVAALERLQRDGLSRHDGIHAIGAVLVEHMNATVRTGREWSGEDYEQALRHLAVESWRRKYGGR